jgi:hypothetical protein
MAAYKAHLIKLTKEATQQHQMKVDANKDFKE